MSPRVDLITMQLHAMRLTLDAMRAAMDAIIAELSDTVAGTSCCAKPDIERREIDGSTQLHCKNCDRWFDIAPAQQEQQSGT